MVTNKIDSYKFDLDLGSPTFSSFAAWFMPASGAGQSAAGNVGRWKLKVIAHVIRCYFGAYQYKTRLTLCVWEPKMSFDFICGDCFPSFELRDDPGSELLDN